MVSALVCRSSGPGSSPGPRHRVVFLCNTLYSRSASLHPGVQIVTGELNAGLTLRWTSIPSRGDRNTPNRFMLQKPRKLQCGEPLVSYAHFTLIT